MSWISSNHCRRETQQNKIPEDLLDVVDALKQANVVKVDLATEPAQAHASILSLPEDICAMIASVGSELRTTSFRAAG
jgi:hypothetical protein